jgi:hypoxanthine phosphoribosyltransferase
MNDAPLKILLDRETIARRVRELGEKITRDLREANLCVVPVMDGGMIFAADLMRGIHLPMTLSPIKASSYGDATISSGTVRLPCGTPEGIEGKDLLVVDDILDTGRTLEVLRIRFRAAGAASVRTCILLRKESASHLPADYIGFEIPEKFVVGYGLDLAGLHRNLPDIRVASSF